GLSVNSFYSWSMSMDNASSAQFPVIPTSLFNLDNILFNATFNFAVGCTYGSINCPSTAPAPPAAGALVALTTTGARQAITTPYLIPQDPNNHLKDDRGLSDFDQSHRFVMDYSWEVPSLSKAWGWPKWMDNWAVSGILNAQSGQPYTIFAGPLFGELNSRVNVAGNVTSSED